MITKDGRLKGPLLTALIGEAINKSAVEAKPEPLNNGLSLPPVKKNCFKCEYLEWIDTGDEYSGGGGYCCNKRNYRSTLEEDNHLGRLEQESYLGKGKSCCEPKQR